MQLSSGTQIPDGLLAAMTLLNEKPRLGVPSKNPAPNQGIDERNSTAAIGMRLGERLNSVGQSRRARYYASNMGRFMSPDWADKPEAVPYSKLDNPQSLNLYGYVLNNPLSKDDPDGHCPWCEQVFEEDIAPNLPSLSEIGAGAVKYGGVALNAVGTFAAGVMASSPDAPATTSVPMGMSYTLSAKGQVAAADANDTANSGPKAAAAPGVTAGGQATDKYGNKIGPSGKPQVNEVDHSGKKGAKDAARNEGKGKPEQHASPKKGDPHFHPTDENGEKQPTSTHHNYPQ